MANTENLWFSNYLKGRTQYTEVNGILSNPRTVQMGVPQSSVAGPLLFIIFINDLASATELDTLLFADDTTFQCNGTYIDELFNRVNINLLKAESWFLANQLTLNALKTKYILFHDKNKSPHIHIKPLFLYGLEIERVGDDCT